MKKKQLSGLIALVLLLACSPKEKNTMDTDMPNAAKQEQQSIDKLDNTANKTKQLGIQLENMDLSVRPQDDFFTFANGKWFQRTEIPADKSTWGAFNELRDLTDENSLSLLAQLLSQQVTSQSEAEKIKTTFRAFMDIEARNAQGIKPLQSEFKQIDALKDLNGLQQILINRGQRGAGNPFYDWYVYADMKQAMDNAVYLTGGSILLPKDYYQKKTDHNQQVIARYQEFVASILTRIGYQEVDKLAQQIVQLEQQMADNLLTNEQERDASLYYNPRTVKELAQISQKINLAEFLDKVGVKTTDVIVDQIKYYQNLDKLLSTTDLKTIQAYLKYWIVVTQIGVLDADLANQYFEFFNQYLKGQKEQRALNKKALDYINNNLGELFGKVYVERYFSAAAKEQMLELIDYLKKSYRSRIENLTWMGAETKQKALIKLDKLAVKVGYPDNWEDYSELNIAADETNLYTINTLITKWKYNKDLAKIGKKVDKTKWAMPPQTVNAYYSPMKNEIVFPAGILQSPFFNLNAEMALNFGGIGAVIGHEITHAFDDSGAMFDAEGNLNNWWSKEDKQRFDALTERVVEQFNRYQVVDDHYINGKFTLGENIADLGGVNIAYDAFQLYQKDKMSNELSSKQAATDKQTNTEFSANQKFFISWASVWRTKSTKQYLQDQVKTDPHSPGYFRAFAPLTNVDAFYQAFDVQAGDKLYKEPIARISIW